VRLAIIQTIKLDEVGTGSGPVILSPVWSKLYYIADASMTIMEYIKRKIVEQDL